METTEASRTTPEQRAAMVIRAFALIRQAIGPSFPELYLGYEFFGLGPEGWPEEPTEPQERNSQCGHAMTSLSLSLQDFERDEFGREELIALFRWKAEREVMAVNQCVTNGTGYTQAC